MVVQVPLATTKPGHPETFSSSSAWANALAVLWCYFRARPMNASTTSFSLQGSPSHGKKTWGKRPKGAAIHCNVSGQRRNQHCRAYQGKTPPCRGSLCFLFQYGKGIVLSCPACPPALLDTSQAPGGSV